MNCHHEIFAILTVLAQLPGALDDLDRVGVSQRELMDMLIGLAVVAVPILLGLFVGRAIERRHFRDLAARETAMSHVLISDLRSFPEADPDRPGAEMMVGQVVIANDPLKSLMARLRKIIGGTIHSYETLMDRARREAILRVVEQAHAAGFDAVCNVRVEFTDIAGSASGSGQQRWAASVCVLASGTAYCIGRGRNT